MTRATGELSGLPKRDRPKAKSPKRHFPVQGLFGACKAIRSIKSNDGKSAQKPENPLLSDAEKKSKTRFQTSEDVHQKYP